MAILLFERSEKKYLLSDLQKERFLNRIALFVTEDRYGAYTLENLYFDNNSFDNVR